MTDPHRIGDIAALEALYGAPAPAAVLKVARQLTPAYRASITQARFCVLATVGPEGADCSPRGDDGPVVQELDPHRLALPDWHGNNRVDRLRNIVRDGRAALMFMVPEWDNVVRVNGRASVTVAPELLQRFARAGRLPRTVVVLEIAEVYFQCARALLRSRLWAGEAAPGTLPSAGDFLQEQASGGFDGAAYDAEWPERARGSLW